MRKTAVTHFVSGASLIYYNINMCTILWSCDGYAKATIYSSSDLYNWYKCQVKQKKQLLLLWKRNNCYSCGKENGRLTKNARGSFERLELVGNFSPPKHIVTLKLALSS